jgi:DNA polymerase-3 subunit chi
MAPVEVAFHTGVADKLLYACRLLRKAWRSGARVAVAGEPMELQRLDQALWTFEPQEFVPHRRLRAGEAVPPPLQRTPIWLLDPGAAAPAGCEVLVNLGPERRPGDDGFRRIVELVSAEPQDAQAARRRWKQYEVQGWPIRHHPQGAGPR